MAFLDVPYRLGGNGGGQAGAGAGPGALAADGFDCSFTRHVYEAQPQPGAAAHGGMARSPAMRP
ncbi:MAG: hypothetical protein U1F25_19065 [Rubrivivax sp.]